MDLRRVNWVNSLNWVIGTVYWWSNGQEYMTAVDHSSVKQFIHPRIHLWVSAACLTMWRGKNSRKPGTSKKKVNFQKWKKLEQIFALYIQYNSVQLKFEFLLTGEVSINLLNYITYMIVYIGIQICLQKSLTFTFLYLNLYNILPILSLTSKSTPFLLFTCSLKVISHCCPSCTCLEEPSQ